MRKWVVYLIIFMTIFNAGSEKQREAHAILPAVAALTPEAAVAILFAGLAAATAAYEIGIITQQHRDEISASLHEKIDYIQDHVKRGLRMSTDALKGLVVLAVETQQMVSGRALCDQIMRRVEGRANTGNAAKTQRAREQSEGECDPSLRGDPYACCPDFMKKFGTGDKMTSVGRNAFRVFYYGRHLMTQSCCLEWDSLHGRFEVYDQSNHGGTRHRGEKTCAQPDDLDSELCTANKIEKADLLSSRHAPRNGCQ